MVEEDFEDENIPEEDVAEIAEDAWGIYTRGDGQTEYECIEQTVHEYLDNR